jgi:hypothetical protein
MKQHGNDAKQLHHVSVDLDLLRNSVQRLYGASNVFLTKLNDDSGAIVVLPIDDKGVNNALIVNADGSARCFVQVPSDFQSGRGFHDAYYVNGEMTAIFVLPTHDFAFVIDEKTGQVIRTYETR